MLVSVIIPTYNCELYIKEAIESVLEQSYERYEIIVVDDGSTDNTREKLAKYKNKIRYIYQENRGLPAARNKGINISKGSIMAFLDADDKFLPGKLEMQTGVFAANPDVDIVFSGLMLIDEAGEKICDAPWWKYFPVLDAETIFIQKPIQMNAIMIKKDALLKIGGFNHFLTISEDIDIVFRLFLQGCKAEWLKQITACYRQQRESMTRKNFYKSANESQKMLMNFFSKNALPEHIRKLANQSIYNHLVWCAWQFYMANQEEQMHEFLYKSAEYQSVSIEKLEVEWLVKLINMTTPYGKKFDIDEVRSASGWKELMKKIAEDKLNKV